MTDDKTNNKLQIPLPFEEDPERFRRLKSGAIMDNDTGKLVANPGGGVHGFTPETGRAARQRQKTLFKIAQMRGIAAAKGIELPQDAELQTIVEASSSGVEALTKHMAQTFMKSSNLRGMGEVYGKLVSLLVDDEKDNPPEPYTLSALRDVLGELAEAAQKSLDKQQAVDGDVKDITE